MTIVICLRVQPTGRQCECSFSLLPELTRLIFLDTVSGGEDVRPVDEGTPADEDVVKLLLLQDGHLPGVLG